MAAFVAPEASGSGEAADTGVDAAPTAAAAHTATEEGVNYRRVVQQRVAALFAEHGDEFLQRRLQEEIAVVKKKVSELSTLKKRIAATSRNVTGLLEAKHKSAVQRAKAEVVCHKLQAKLTQYKELLAEIAQSMSDNRDEVRARVEEKLRESQADVDARSARLAQLQQENAELEARVSEGKRALDAERENFNTTFEKHLESTQKLVERFNATKSELREAEDTLAATRRTGQIARNECNMLEEQLKVYTERYAEFASSSMKPEEVGSLAEKQRAQAEAQIANLEKEKAEASQMRLSFDNETVELRAKAAALKRELQQAEKARTAAEKRCRLAQQKVRKE